MWESKPVCGLEWQGHSNVIRVQALCINTHLGSFWADQERSLEQALEECQLDHMISPLFNSSAFGIVCKWSILDLFGMDLLNALAVSKPLLNF